MRDRLIRAKSGRVQILPAHTTRPPGRSARAGHNGAVEVWHVPLRIPAAAVARWRPALDAGQRAQARRLRHPLLRRRAAAAQAALHALLARRLGCEASALRLARGAFGKPHLTHPEAGRGLHFNLSHSGDHALVALAAEGPVGVDIEVLDPRVSLEDLLPAFTAAERAEIGAAPLAERRWHAWRCWVRKEAVLKALGCGLAGGLDRFVVSTGEAACIVAGDLPGLAPGRWQLAPLDRPGQWAAAVAWQGPSAAPMLRPWRWDAA